MMALSHFANVIINAEQMDYKGVILRVIVNFPMIGLIIYDIVKVVITKGEYEVSAAAHIGGAFTGITEKI